VRARIDYQAVSVRLRTVFAIDRLFVRRSSPELPMSHAIALSAEEFDGFTTDPSLVLVDFWAPWCAPCRALSPTIDALNKQFDGRVRIGKLDIDQAPAIAMRLGVRGIPTLVLFKDGKPIDQKLGPQSKNALVQWLETYL
jgi:thioredoxin 1